MLGCELHRTRGLGNELLIRISSLFACPMVHGSPLSRRNEKSIRPFSSTSSSRVWKLRIIARCREQLGDVYEFGHCAAVELRWKWSSRSQVNKSLKNDDSLDFRRDVMWWLRYRVFGSWFCYELFFKMYTLNRNEKAWILIESFFLIFISLWNFVGKYKEENVLSLWRWTKSHKG